MKYAFISTLYIVYDLLNKEDVLKLVLLLFFRQLVNYRSNNT